MTCHLCKATEGAISTRLYRDGNRFTTVARCEDRAGCRARVEAGGQRWDVGEYSPRMGKATASALRLVK